MWSSWKRSLNEPATKSGDDAEKSICSKEPMRDEHEANDSDVPEGTDVDGLLLEMRVSDESEKYNSMVDVDDCPVLS